MIEVVGVKYLAPRKEFEKKNRETSRMLMWGFFVCFCFHLGATIYSLLFNLPQAQKMADFFSACFLPYLGVFAGYLGKSSFDHSDMARNELRKYLADKGAPASPASEGDNSHG